MMHAKKMRCSRVFPGKAPLALAIAGLLAIQTAGATETDKPKKGAVELKQVTVTATGREQRSQDVPYNLSVMSSDELNKAGVSSLADLARQIPGMTYIDLGARSNGINNGIILRGLNSASAGINDSSPAAGDQTVSMYLNSTPIFSNLKITDVERVEVLRGPQGTLYGSGSIGGTIRFIFNKPDTDAFSGDIQTKYSQSAHAGEPNYAFDAVLNMPLSKHSAFRLAAGYEDTAGVIDALNLMKFDSNGVPLLANPSDYFGSTGVFYKKKDVDNSSIRYFRGSFSWDITDKLNALLTAHHQENKSSDFTGISPNASGLTETRYGTSPSEVTTNLFSLELTDDLGFATLTSSTSYSKDKLDSVSDYTNYGLEYESYYAGYPRIDDYTKIDYDTTRFTQEFRLVGKNSDTWDWVAGAYYSREKQVADVATYIPGWAQFTNTAGDPTAVAALGEGATFAQYYQSFYPDATFKDDYTWLMHRTMINTQKAIYGELSYHITPAWQVTAGGRFFQVGLNRTAVQIAPMSGSAGYFSVKSKSSDTDSIFKFNTSYAINDQTNAYFTWAQGFRQGGINSLPQVGWYAADPSLTKYKPDYSNNWEIGAKGTLNDNRLRYSVAAYYIDWKNIQLQIPAPVSGIPTIVNGGNAVSKGLELEGSALLTRSLLATFGYTYTDARLTQDFTVESGYNGNSGDRLPGVPKQTINGSLSYTQLLPWGGAHSQLLYRVDASYRSATATALNEESENYARLGGFTTLNASVTWSNSQFRAGLFINNISDVRGITAVDITDDTKPSSRPGSLYFIQRPRTIGMTVGYSF